VAGVGGSGVLSTAGVGGVGWDAEARVIPFWARNARHSANPFGGGWAFGWAIGAGGEQGGPEICTKQTQVIYKFLY